MRTAVVLTAVLSLALAACGGSASTPPPAPSAGAPPTPVAGGPGDVAATVTAINIAFEPTELSAPAGAPFVILLDNQDQGVPHNLEVKGSDGSTIVQSEIITGPATLPVPLPELEPGAYPFLCTVHPNMTGTLTVE